MGIDLTQLIVLWPINYCQDPRTLNAIQTKPLSHSSRIGSLLWPFSMTSLHTRLAAVGHSDVLIVWHLCSVTNWVKYMQWLLRSKHLCFRRSFDYATRINFLFRLLIAWSSTHGRDASSCKILCRYLYPVRWHFSEIQDGGRRHLGFSGYENLAIPTCW